MTSGRLAPPPVAAHARLAHRAAFALTPRSLGLLAAGLIFIAPAWLDRRALLLLLLWDGVIVLLIAINLRRLTGASEMHVERRWSGPLTIESASDISLDIQNRGTVAVIVRLADYVSGQLRRDLPDMEVAVAPHGEAQVTYAISPTARGDMTMGDVALRMA